ncbi:MAG: response regulator transcription factor [Fimbriimonadaceae bacterium]|nr:response regulator transcription factor [Fimbriimonadaceae bacterium]
MIRIYVFGDREPMIEACRYSLGRLGYVVYTPPEVTAFLEGVYSQPPNLVIIDLVADGLGGLRLCRELRSDPKFRQLPVIAVATPPLLSGLRPEAGYDDLLVEPFTPEEVEARVRLVQFRLQSVASDDTVQVGPLRLDLAAYQASVEGQRMELTHLEFELLKFLATHRGVAYTREMLLSLVWGEDYYGGTRTVDVHVRRLRAKLGAQHEDLIQTVRGVGYRFEES